MKRKLLSLLVLASAAQAGAQVTDDLLSSTGDLQAVIASAPSTADLVTRAPLLLQALVPIRQQSLQSARNLRRIDPDSTLEQIREPLTTLTERVSDLARLTTTRQYPSRGT